MKVIEHIFNEAFGVRLTAYLQDTSPEYAGVKTRPAVLVLPGGGYGMCSDREADCVAIGYLNAGFHAFVLRYTLKQHAAWPAPLNDYDAAIEFIQAHAAEWTVDCDRIAVCGFSAGGHLAASAATMAKHRPAAAILGYPVIRQDISDACALGMPTPLDHVDENTCPCFLFAARDDECVPISSTIEFQEKLYNHNIPFECHIYPRGNHGYTIGKMPLTGENLRASRWMEDSIAWLGETWGALTANGCANPILRRYTHRNNEEKFSLSCTYGYLKSRPETQEFMKGIDEILSKCTPDIMARLETCTIRDILYSAGYNLGTIHQFGYPLSQIKKGI